MVLGLKGMYLVSDGVGVMPICRSFPHLSSSSPTARHSSCFPKAFASALLHLVPALGLALWSVKVSSSLKSCLQGPSSRKPSCIAQLKAQAFPSECPPPAPLSHSL